VRTPLTLLALAAYCAAMAYAINWSSGFPAAPPYSVVALAWIAGLIVAGVIVKILWYPVSRWILSLWPF
jgi:hypothetical protein